MFLISETLPTIVKSPKTSVVKSPLIVDVSNVNEFLSLIETFPSEIIETLPVKSFSELSNKIPFVECASKAVVPPTESAPFCEISFAATFKLFAILDVSNLMVLVSISQTSPPETTETVLPKLL